MPVRVNKANWQIPVIFYIAFKPTRRYFIWEGKDLLSIHFNAWRILIINGSWHDKEWFFSCDDKKSQVSNNCIYENMCNF